MDKVVSTSFFCSIGGLTFHLSATGPPLLQEIAEPYRQFFSDSPAGDPADEVLVRIGAEPFALPQGRPLFDSGVSWSLYADAAERIIVYQPPALPDPLCVARFVLGTRTVLLSCSERSLETERGIRVCRSPFHYPLDQLLAMYFLGGRGLIVHAAGMAFAEGGVAFCGVSGAGKSTICRLVAGRAGFSPFSDDRVILSVRQGERKLYGTPWPGEGRIAENRRVDLRWLIFLEQGAANGIRPLKPSESLPRLLRTASLPWFDQKSLDAGLQTCADLLGGVRTALFTFRPEPAAVDTLERFLAKETVKLVNRI